MNIVLVSQCSKRALPGTRRILDQFAERKGDRVWQTAITQQGLNTLRKMLRKTARRNTAVSCHWVRRRDHSEILWIVGNLRRFNADGSVPTNTTARDILRRKDENNWHSVEAISLLAGIAGLFHDFGKANALFQDKLKPGAKHFTEPYRHEWVSLRLFQAFVYDCTDPEWLKKLAEASVKDESPMLVRLIKDAPGNAPNPFTSLPPLAQTVGWLILSHHRLPKYNSGREPPLEIIDQWLTHRSGLRSTWNSPQADYDDWTPKQRVAVWEFPEGTPLRSVTWCAKANSIAKRALKLPKFAASPWWQDRFSLHVARLNLMLADHSYSAGAALVKWQDKEYKAFANTDKKTRQRKQKLDEHNVGVGHNAVLLSKSLPRLRDTLPAITRHKAFKVRSRNARFRWQDNAYELACGVRDRSVRQGFFGVNMASTGCGKTFANARIMYGLASEAIGCRFNVALGLRTLTLQTGDALRDRLHLSDEDIAVLIGSPAVRDLHEQSRSAAGNGELEPQEAMEQSGSASGAALLESHQYVRYDGSLDDGRLGEWIRTSPKLHALLSAPVLVSTIDHLIPATEGERGGKQIAPMLRLLTSDLVLDEPDDFGLEDLPALCRLVNWAGMLGSRLLLSSATLPPALIEALFDAYREGRKAFSQACGEPGVDRGICCAWFDEFSRTQTDLGDLPAFARAHNRFVAGRIMKLRSSTPLRLAELLPVKAVGSDKEAVVEAVTDVIARGVTRLHQAHHQVHAATGKRVSVGLVRMANINSMVTVLQHYIACAPAQGSRVHFVCYHSHHPLLVRSMMEARLDAALTRHDEDALWQVPEIASALENHTEQDQVFIVFASPVAEVGRDHDYDWAIAEPSSMRSIIQLAGRIQRHRARPPDSPNLLVLSKNMRALRGSPVAYERPGFEDKHFKLHAHDLQTLLEPWQYEHISAIPRIQESPQPNPCGNFVDLEHAQLRARLFGESAVDDESPPAAYWWQHQATWSAELQRRSRFRKSQPEEEFILRLNDEEDTPIWHLVHENGEAKAAGKGRIQQTEGSCHSQCQSWMQFDFVTLINELAERRELGVLDTSDKFARVRLPKSSGSTETEWLYRPELGVWRALW